MHNSHFFMQSGELLRLHRHGLSFILKSRAESLVFMFMYAWPLPEATSTTLSLSVMTCSCTYHSKLLCKLHLELSSLGSLPCRCYSSSLTELVLFLQIIPTSSFLIACSMQKWAEGSILQNVSDQKLNGSKVLGMRLDWVASIHMRTFICCEIFKVARLKFMGYACKQASNQTSTHTYVRNVVPLV